MEAAVTTTQPVNTTIPAAGTTTRLVVGTTTMLVVTVTAVVTTTVASLGKTQPPGDTGVEVVMPAVTRVRGISSVAVEEVWVAVVLCSEDKEAGRG